MWFGACLRWLLASTTEKAMPLQLLANLGWHEFSVLLFALLLALVFFLVLRQNQKDFLEIEAWVTEKKPGF
jgi:cytochrome c biogenesis factor